MAYYHLTIKSDVKPDGKKILATNKVDYVNREGKYKNIDDEKIKLHDKCQESISSANQIENPPKITETLYESPFGIIIRSTDGSIKISQDASVETVGIALQLAQKIFKGDLKLSGSKKFITRCEYTAADLDLQVNFSDADIQNNIKKVKEEKNYDARNRNGGIPRRTRQRQLKRRRDQRRRSTPFLSIGDTAERSREIFTFTGKRLPHMSKRDVVIRGEGTSMLVQRDERVHLHDEGKILNRPAMRWSLSSGRRNRIAESVNQIIKNMETNLDRVYASSHLQYINREAAFQKRGGCIDKGHHLPKWAKDDPKVFFSAADRYGPKNDERYKEFEFALPNELSLEEQKKIIETFISHHLSDHYYAWAIHDKTGTMDNGQQHPHVHIMFSTKLIDEQEKKQERTPEMFFKKYNFRYPERGGPKKSKKYTGENRNKVLNEIREDYAKIQNDALRAAGIPLRVDHRTKNAQYKDAMSKGYVTLAKLLKLYPEKYIDTNEMLNQNSSGYNEKKKYRDYKDEYIKKLQAADHLERLIEEERMQENISSTRKKLINILSSENPDEDSEQEIRKLKQELIKLMDQEVDLNGVVLKENDAIREAQASLMSKEEREKFQAYWNLKEEKRNWLEFKIKLKKPTGAQNEELIYERLLDEINFAISNINKQISKAEGETVLKNALIRLSNPAFEKKIMFAKINLLNENKPTRDKYFELCNEIKNKMAELQNLIDDYSEKARKESYKKIYSGDDILKALYKQRKYLAKHLSQLEKSHARQEKKVISLERAHEMAKNNYVRGDYKKLREELRTLKKQEDYYASDIEKLNKLKAAGGNENEIREEEIRLQKKRIDLDATRKQLDKTRIDLDKRCEQPKAMEKIIQIEKGILLKNHPEITRRDYLARKISECKKEIKDIDQRIADLKKTLQHEQPTIRYKVNAPKDMPHAPMPRHSATEIIANALIGDQEYASFVYRSNTGKEDWQRDWAWMTTADKDEAHLRKVYSDDY